VRVRSLRGINDECSFRFGVVTAIIVNRSDFTDKRYGLLELPAFTIEVAGSSGRGVCEKDAMLNPFSTVLPTFRGGVRRAASRIFHHILERLLCCCMRREASDASASALRGGTYVSASMRRQTPLLQARQRARACC